MAWPFILLGRFVWRLLAAVFSGDGPLVGTQLYNFKPLSHIPLDRLIISLELEKQLTRWMAPSSLASSRGASSSVWSPTENLSA